MPPIAQAPKPTRVMFMPVVPNGVVGRVTVTAYPHARSELRATDLAGWYHHPADITIRLVSPPDWYHPMFRRLTAGFERSTSMKASEEPAVAASTVS